MAYLGRGIENLSDRVVLDALTASATASYTLQLNSVNFVPSSASSLTVSLNGVIQKPDSSYTVSGSTLTFSSALTSSDSIDFIIAERGITLQTPSAGSVNTDQLAASAVTNAKISSTAAIATTKLGSGAVLQVVNSSNSGNSSNTTSISFTDTVNTLNITPLSSNSKIVVMADHAVAIAPGSDDTRIDARLRETTTSTTIGDKRFIGADQTTLSKLNLPFALVGVLTNSSTAQKTFTVQVRKGNGTASESGAIDLNWYSNALHNMIAMEILP